MLLDTTSAAHAGHVPVTKPPQAGRGAHRPGDFPIPHAGRGAFGLKRATSRLVTARAATGGQGRRSLDLTFSLGVTQDYDATNENACVKAGRLLS